MRWIGVLGFALLVLGVVALLDESDDESSKPTVVAVEADDVQDALVRPLTRDGRESSGIESPFVEDDVARRAAATQPEHDRSYAPTDLQLWSELYTGADGLVHGTLDAAHVLALWDGVLSRLDGAHATVHEETGVVTYTLLDDGRRGAVELVARPEGSPLAAITIQADLRSSPGQFTGYPEDASTETRLEFATQLDAEGTPRFLNATAQVMHHHTQDLRDQARSRGTPVPTGGIFRMTHDGASWTPILSAPGPDDSGGTPTWRHTFGGPRTSDVDATALHRGFSRIGGRLSHLQP